MDAALFAMLKHKLKTGKQFGDIWHYFFDHFVEKKAFLELGKPIQRHEMIEIVLQKLARNTLKTKKIILQMRLIEVADYQFIHGCGMLNGNLTSVMYFEDDQIGLINFVRPDGMSEMARFTGQIIPDPDYTPSKN